MQIFSRRNQQLPKNCRICSLCSERQHEAAVLHVQSSVGILSFKIFRTNSEGHNFQSKRKISIHIWHLHSTTPPYFFPLCKQLNVQNSDDNPGRLSHVWRRASHNAIDHITRIRLQLYIHEIFEYLKLRPFSANISGAVLCWLLAFLFRVGYNEASPTKKTR